MYYNIWPEGSTNMMILKDSTVIIEYSRLWTRHDVEVVGGAGVLIVMDQRRHQCCQDLNIIQPILLENISVNYASLWIWYSKL